jgi:hypothetical protein
LIEVTGSEEWEPIETYIKKSIQEYELSYKQLIAIVLVSRYADLISKAELQKRET